MSPVTCKEGGCCSKEKVYCEKCIWLGKYAEFGYSGDTISYECSHADCFEGGVCEVDTPMCRTERDSRKRINKLECLNSDNDCKRFKPATTRSLLKRFFLPAERK